MGMMGCTAPDVVTTDSGAARRKKRPASTMARATRGETQRAAGEISGGPFAWGGSAGQTEAVAVAGYVAATGTGAASSFRRSQPSASPASSQPNTCSPVARSA
jgi:hypothetical protein